MEAPLRFTEKRVVVIRYGENRCADAGRRGGCCADEAACGPAMDFVFVL